MKERVRMHRDQYKPTISACFTGYIVQAIVNNFAPLLFVTLQNTYQIPLGKITMLITVNFGVQLLVDFLSAFWVDKIGYRKSILAAHICAAVGIVGLAVFPVVLPNAYAGLLAAVVIYAIGGGLIEVLISPIMESCPTGNKEKAMSLLHSFYCWGQVAVVLLTTVFFQWVGIQNWRILACVWALVPLGNVILFARVPMAPLVEEGAKSISPGQVLRTPLFWILAGMMVCAGASELSVSQWASTFVEQGLQVSKAVGDLAGPMAFAVLMGCARLFYGKFGDRMNLERFMIGSGILCVLSYLGITLVPSPVVSLAACGICGLSVGIMWPGTFSMAAATLKNGGTMVFALLALAGDLGCSGGPTLAGLVAQRMGGDLKIGILAAVCFPLLLIAGILLCRKRYRRRKEEQP